MPARCPPNCSIFPLWIGLRKLLWKKDSINFRKNINIERQAQCDIFLILRAQLCHSCSPIFKASFSPLVQIQSKNGCNFLLRYWLFKFMLEYETWCHLFERLMPLLCAPFKHNTQIISPHMNAGSLIAYHFITAPSGQLETADCFIMA